jgi:hypothetical protein
MILPSHYLRCKSFDWLNTQLCCFSGSNSQQQ